MVRRLTVEYDDTQDHDPQWEHMKMLQYLEAPNMALSIYGFHKILLERRESGGPLADLYGALADEYYEYMRDYMELTY